MSPLRYSIFAAALAAAIGAGGVAHAADRDKDDDRPGVRRCTNDPKLANDLQEYLRDCPAAQGLLNESGAWVAVEHGPADTPSTAGARSNMTTPGAPGGSSIGTPSAPKSTGGTMGTPSAPGGGSMGTPSAPSGGASKSN